LEDTPHVPLIVIRVQAPTPTVEEFMFQYCRYFGVDVAFLPTEGVQPPGRRVRFGFVLADGTEAISGEGQVLRMRRDTNQRRPPGMEVRYQCLNEPSQRVVDRMLVLRTQGWMSRPDPPPYVSILLEREGLEPLDSATSMLPANPFAEVPPQALSYFVDWALERATDLTRARWRRRRTEFAKIKMRPPRSEKRTPRLGLVIALATALVLVVADDFAERGRATSASRLRPRQTARENAIEGHKGGVGGNVPVADHAPVAPPIAHLPAVPVPHDLAEPPDHAAVMVVSKPRVPLTVVSKPSGWVHIDDRLRGHSPLTTMVEAGPHEVVVDRPRYLPGHAHFAGTGRVVLELQRPPATLHVTSTPSGALVRVDKHVAGRTPLSVTATGYEQHRVEVEYEGRVEKHKLYLKPPVGSVDFDLGG
jgi:hypothetical protein